MPLFFVVRASLRNMFRPVLPFFFVCLCVYVFVVVVLLIYYVCCRTILFVLCIWQRCCDTDALSECRKEEARCQVNA